MGTSCAGPLATPVPRPDEGMTESSEHAADTGEAGSGEAGSNEVQHREAGSGGAEPHLTRSSTAGAGKAGPRRADPARADRGKADPSKADPGKTNPGKTSRGKAIPPKAAPRQDQPGEPGARSAASDDAGTSRVSAMEFRAIHISGYDRVPQDFYPTPDWVTEALLKHATLRGPIWEPCCGDGAMARVLETAGHKVVATDLVDRGFGRGDVDFFDCSTFPPGCRSMVTNPPYGDGGDLLRPANSAASLQRFVRHALDLTMRANGQLALLARFQWIAGKRAAALISSGPLSRVVVLTKRIQWFDRGELTNTGQHHHVWLFWDCRHGGLLPPSLVFAP